MTTAAAIAKRTKQWRDRPLPAGTPGLVRGARQRKKWTQTQLATAAGVTLRCVQTVEAGTKQPTVATLQKLADALGVKVAKLLTDERRETP